LDKSKQSKRGRLKLIKDENNQFKTVRAVEPGEDLLVEIFRDGEILKELKLDEIRKNADIFGQ